MTRSHRVTGYSAPTSCAIADWLICRAAWGTRPGFTASHKWEVRRPMRSALRYAALASCACFALAACTISPPTRIGAAAAARAAPRREAPAMAACPAGHLLPHGAAGELEWVDFLQFDGRQYIAGL